MTIELHHGDCLSIMPTLPDRSFDAIIADLPYGTTACKWDSVIPFEPLWVQYKRLIKKRGAIVLFGSQPFTSALVMSNLEWFRYEWIWHKTRIVGFLNANRRPMTAHESILLFCEGQSVYNPQMRKGKMHKRNGKQRLDRMTPNYGKFKSTGEKWTNLFYPQSVFTMQQDPAVTVTLAHRPNKEKRHPTQKPVALLEYLIKTYTNEGDAVLDNVMGSGTTMVACINTERNGVGIEMLPVEQDDPDYFGIAEARVKQAQNETVQLSF